MEKGENLDSLWPETQALVRIEQEMMRHMQEMKKSLGFMEKLHEKIFKEIEPGLMTFKPISFKVDSEGENFALTLDTKDFPREHLSVKQVGRKLWVSGKTEKKEEDGKGSYSYKRHEFHQQFELPEGVNPEDVTCSLSDGQLQIQAPRLVVPALKERVVPINCVPGLKSLEGKSSSVEQDTAKKSSSKK
ncbi:hypothetical protein Z043_114388 [Scleropages formosus]|uniref:SHSP domain-containing protein n=1 Tax=Scleropages formosus TaxID=113540 RepID=A0A0P7UA45_SCLFO|nr:hypothetical protein Z043_114388 [Scleropages formosus]